MSDPARNIDALIAQAKAQDLDALTSLSQYWREWLSSQENGSDERSSQTIEATISRACASFGVFEGSSESELHAWIVLQHRRHEQNEQTAASGYHVHEETLDGSPSEPEAWDPEKHTGAETLDPVNTPRNPKDTETLAQESSSLADPTTGQLQTFGDYDLLQMIAKGGMGVVYKAKQRRLNRTVAVKMILSGQFADPLEVERFYAEAKAAAKLQHPNIVTIHEVGQCRGQHFFSMDYIEGSDLAALVREHPLPPRRAAQYAKTIAETMQYAHDQGILHRDLKPSNILLDGRNEPHITDFGLAKQVEGQSQLTISGAIVGTPSYMPPEQASGQSEKVGVASDVYSLGAILYELLTGGPPFRGASPFETVRQVMETEPVRPRLLNPSIPRDMETICLTCLQKEIPRRYASAGALADELERYLEGKPIQARPVGVLERAWRWCRRNPVAASLLSATVAGICTAIVAIVVGYVQTSAALVRAEANFQQARSAVDELFTLVSEDTLLNEPGMQPVRKELLQRALGYYQSFIEERGDDPALEDELAETLYRVGHITELIDSPEKALEPYLRALAIQKRRSAQQPDDTQRSFSLGNTLNAIGRVHHKSRKYDQASKYYQQALQERSRLVSIDPLEPEFQGKQANTMMNVALVEGEQGKFSDAEKHHQEAQSIREKILQKDATNRWVGRDLAMGYYNLANLSRALCDQALADGNKALAKENFQMAIDHFEKSIAEFETLMSSDPDDLANQHDLAICYRKLADQKLQIPDPAAAMKFYQKALAQMRPLTARNPDVPQYQFTMAGLHLNLGQLQRGKSTAADASRSLETARELFEPLVKQFPQQLSYQRDLAITLRILGIEYAIAGRWDDADGQLEQSQRLLAQLAQGHPESVDFKNQLDQTLKAIEQLKKVRPSKDGDSGQEE